MFTFTPLLGAQSTSPASSSLLELDGGAKILVDVGWNDQFDTSKLDALQNHVSTLSLVLLTHATFDHLGAYAHCCKHIPSFARIPCYATTPVINLGKTLLTDLYASSPLAASRIPSAAIAGVQNETQLDLLLVAPTTDEIAGYFSHINPLKYSQPHQPVPSPSSAPVNNLTITAYSAGHTLGGTIWHVQHGLESIVYAADWNQGRENLLGGAAWLSTASGGAEIIEPLRRPTALICSSKGVEKEPSEILGRRKRDDLLISLIRETISNGGKVLIPTDSSARVLELAFVLEQTWRENVDGPYSALYKRARILMASRTSTTTVRFMQSMLEWMEDAVIRDAEATMTGKANKSGGPAHSPLDWQYVRTVEKKTQIDRALSRNRPCIMLASDASMEWGFSRQALESLASDSRNLVILAEKGNSGLGKTLWDLYTGQEDSQSVAKVVSADGAAVQFRKTTTAALSDEETSFYEQYLTRQRQLHSTQQGDSTIQEATTTNLADPEADESSESEDEDEDIEHQGRALNLSAQMNNQNKRRLALSDAELGINVLLKTGKNTVHDYDVRGKRGREKIFPYVALRHKADEFGETIKAEDFLRAEERDEVDGTDLRADGSKAEAGVGQKRKWDDVAVSAPTAAAAKGGKGEGKKNKKSNPEEQLVKHAPDDIDAAIARATGQTLPSQGGTNGDLAESSSSEDEESDYEPEETAAATSGPRKAVFEYYNIELHCRLAYVDFTGLHEKRDLQMLIPLIRPRKLILISGTESETKVLADECRDLLSITTGESGPSTNTEVFVPTIGESVDASVDTNAWMLKLSRQLVKKLTWQHVKGLGVVALTGRLEAGAVESDLTVGDVKAEDNDEKSRKKQKVASKAAEQSRITSKPVLPILDLFSTAGQATSTAAAAASAANTTTKPVHVGDLRLADLRRLLQSTGHRAEFRGEGTLLIDGTVVVRKSALGRVEVESAGGGLSLPLYRTAENEGTFWAVRRAIYGGLGVVEG
ncbi:hypothetical protein K431DRAFT_286084 [Polychaeton citri CBS 116435]|uniref:Cleavage and polyadenylation specificity factor subunit 2 n=1 Tax=Polychaeton citri CBS 116435 TaxID=1314669 RepID=A0A9P4Q695_9PEZI|nr:hypothetical protein K431DRAFT_286084 [Polychaeton citri CBS 116435]